ncbi:MAG: c-type cytochrome [Polyangiaceae bacterium]|nr:c-type cytochrome [Polyangiaceae bacterium]
MPNLARNGAPAWGRAPGTPCGSGEGERVPPGEQRGMSHPGRASGQVPRRGALRVQAWVLFAGLSVAAGCGAAGDEQPSGDAPRAGGDTTVIDRSSNAFTFPAPNLDAEDLASHLDGDVAFEATFVTAPAPRNPGLGPLFNNNGCAKCHVRDGRGLPEAGRGPHGSPLLVRVSASAGEPAVPGGAVAVEGLGTQLQDHAVYGATPEVTVAIRWVEQPGEYGDGEPFSLRRPVFEITLASGEPLPRDVMTSARIPPPVFGLGLLEAVAEDDIVARADPDDADGDGISGRPNYVWDEVRGAPSLGRFGWKANVPSLLQQAAAAYSGDMGVSSPMFPEADGTSEVDERTLGAAAFYTATLAVPGRYGWSEPEVKRGEALFREARCATCHVEELRTGEQATGALRGQTFHPYTDLLLHNMGFDLADGRPDFMASGTEWRTAPLWGLGLTHTVLPYSSFLHDGRARSIEEAILWHGGEAEASKEAFRVMAASDRAALMEFLRSL